MKFFQVNWHKASPWSKLGSCFMMFNQKLKFDWGNKEKLANRMVCISWLPHFKVVSLHRVSQRSKQIISISIFYWIISNNKHQVSCIFLSKKISNDYIILFHWRRGLKQYIQQNKESLRQPYWAPSPESANWRYNRKRQEDSWHLVETLRNIESTLPRTRTLQRNSSSLHFQRNKATSGDPSRKTPYHIETVPNSNNPEYLECCSYALDA